MKEVKKKEKEIKNISMETKKEWLQQCHSSVLQKESRLKLDLQF
jgi:hypothetical protein